MACVLTRPSVTYERDQVAPPPLDLRLNSLTTAEAACCLSLNQASSIQNLGVTCESITVGHNPFKLPLSSAAITLPTNRLSFISEILADGDAAIDATESLTPNHVTVIM